MAVAVEIARRDRAGIRAHGIRRHYRAECSIAVAQADSDVVAAGVGYRHVANAIAIKIADGHRIRRGAGAVIGGGDFLGAAGQHAHAVAVEIAGHQVRDAVAVQIGGGDISRARSRGIISGKLEAAIASPSQQGDASIAIGDCQIRSAVAVEINDSHVVRVGASGIADRGREEPITIAEKYADRAEAIVVDHEVEFAVAVEVPHLDVLWTRNCIGVDNTNSTTAGA